MAGTGALRFVLATALWAVAAAAPHALAQKPKVYRCGPGGTTYSQTPCPAGTEVDAADPRNPSQRREAGDAAARQAKLAQELEAERHQREKSVQNPKAARIGPEPVHAASAPASHPHHGKGKRSPAQDKPPQYRAPEPKP